MSHYKKKHKVEMPSEGRSLLDLSFTIGSRREAVAISSDGELENQESATPCTSTMEQPRDHVAAQPLHRPAGQVASTITHAAIAEIRMP